MIIKVIHFIRSNFNGCSTEYLSIKSFLTIFPGISVIDIIKKQFFTQYNTDYAAVSFSKLISHKIL